jgi:hypothetical protein
MHYSHGNSHRLLAEVYKTGITQIANILKSLHIERMHQLRVASDMQDVVRGMGPDYLQLPLRASGRQALVLA